MATVIKQGKTPQEIRHSLRAISKQVSDILDDVEKRGEVALRDYSERFDHWNPAAFRVSDADIEACLHKVAPAELEVIQYAQRLIRKTAQAQLASVQNMSTESIPGATVGLRHIPVESVANYAPGGQYPMVACSHMAPLVAREAGVRRVVGCAPPHHGSLPTHQIAAMHLAGVDEIYCMGGVQAIAAFAFGTENIAPVRMIVGPGNAYVSEAKRQVFGTVGIDMVAGPSEALSIADDSCDAEMIAIDLLGQAEHGVDSPVALLTTSRELALAMEGAIARYLLTLPTRAVAAKAWDDYGSITLCDSDEEMVRIANDMAFENVHVLTRDPDYFFARLENYGSLFLGPQTCVAFGDRIIGSTHPLPTGKAAMYTGCLWVGTFLKAGSYQRVTAEAAAELGRQCEAFCAIEGFAGHAAQGRLRVERYGHF